MINIVAYTVAESLSNHGDPSTITSAMFINLCLQVAKKISRMSCKKALPSIPYLYYALFRKKYSCGFEAGSHVARQYPKLIKMGKIGIV